MNIQEEGCLRSRGEFNSNRVIERTMLVERLHFCFAETFTEQSAMTDILEDQMPDEDP